MSASDFDPEILRDFAEEAHELLEQLERDARKIEKGGAKTVDSAFRALHTIKGNASYLALDPVIDIAHAGETLLNRARDGEIEPDAGISELLLRTVDALQARLNDLGGEELAHDAELVEALLAAAGEESGSAQENGSPLDDDMGGFLADDLAQSSERLGELIGALGDESSRVGAGEGIAEIAEGIEAHAGFFGIAPLNSIATALKQGSEAAILDAGAVERVVPRLREAHALLGRQVESLRGSEVEEAPPEPAPRPVPTRPIQVATPEPPAPPARAGLGERVVRIDADRLDDLLAITTELCIESARLDAISRSGATSASTRAEFDIGVGTVRRLAERAREAAARARLQPLGRVFARCGAIVDDAAQKTGKNARLDVSGAEIECDKAVVDRLSEPLVHLVRNCVDHGIEPPDERVRADKPEIGAVCINASIEGGNTVVRVSDDGRGLSRDAIASAAIERGLVNTEQLDTLGDAGVFGLLFEPGFSTKNDVTELSGRGVGMDAVRTGVESLGGSVGIASVPGKGTTFTLTFPRSVSRRSVLRFTIGEHVYCVPALSAAKVVPMREMRRAAGLGANLARIEGKVVPVLDATAVGARTGTDPGYALLVAASGRRGVLPVSRVLGHTDLIVRPAYASGPISGAGIADDGSVCPVIDVARLVGLADVPGAGVPAEEA